MDLNEALRLARSSAWLGRQSDGFREAVCAHLRTRLLRKNEVLFSTGADARAIYFIAAGRIRADFDHPALGEMTVYVMYPGDWFGDPAALGRRTRISTVKAREPGYLLTLSIAAINEITALDSSWAWPFFDLLADKVEYGAMHALDLLIPDVRKRFATRLLTLAGRLPGKLPPSPATIPLTQEEIALSSGMSRQSANQILAELVAAGICKLGYGEVTIVDVDGLAREAFTNP